ncbi:hypothetical protein RN001_012845 [Aquatica leii]|uniref:Kelch-like protein diablo n=1 Tax=Aquatica leii TaxID=1421715 RepID=A0AAN7QFL0_9COLE|nr:hypothetical protein RN001_012845 [Aquatica leii]
MPPLKSSSCLADMTSMQNNNYMLISNTNSQRNINYVPKLLNNLNVLRLNSILCDVEIIVEGKVIKAHRAVLAASSPYFNAMFTSDLCEKDQRSVELHAISPNVLTTLIDFVYSGEIEINQNNVQELMIAADMLELEDVVLGCAEYLIKELHAVNAIGIYRFAESHNWRNLQSAALQFIQSHYPQIINEDEIYELPKDQIIQFLSSENLQVDSEFQVFQSAIRWINHDIVERRRYVFEVLKYVRLSLLPIGLLERAITECTDSSLRVALKSIHNDLTSKKGCLVALNVYPRLGAKKHIFVVGGSKREFNNLNRSCESSYVTIERFDTFKREWCKTPNMTVSRIVPGVAALNGNIYVVGGEHGFNSLACGERYNLQDNRWTQISSMSVPRCEFGLCSWNGYLYAVGGWVGGDRGDIGDSIERYNPQTNMWMIIGNLPQPRFSMGVVTYEGLIYLVGGCTEFQRFSQDLLSYNPITGEWNTLQLMSVARSQMGVAVLDDYLYVVGGNNKSQVLSSVERYSFKKGTWSMVPSMSVGRSGPAVAAVDGLLYVIGGYETLENPFYRPQFTVASVECFNPFTNSWSDCPPLPESRAEAGVVVL